MRRSRSSAGFSLIEVLFALAVIGLALGATAGVFGNFGIGHETADDADRALDVAQNLLAEAGATAPLAPGVSAGNDGKFQWQLAVERYNDAEIPDDDRLYRLEARVAWRQGLRQRQFSLATLRLAPAPPP